MVVQPIMMKYVYESVYINEPEYKNKYTDEVIQ